MKLRNALCLSLLLATSLYYQPALAEKGGHGKGHSKGHGHKHSHDDEDYDRGDWHDEHEHHSRNSYSVVFGGDDRVLIREYLVREYGSSCPPGLAKKHNGCLPPGHAKRYYIGQPLHAEWQPVPSGLLEVLTPVPMGYQYVMVDKDVLLISEASKKVIDAVTLLSAVGN